MAIKVMFSGMQIYVPGGGSSHRVKFDPHPIFKAYQEGRITAHAVDLYHFLKKLGLRCHVV